MNPKMLVTRELKEDGKKARLLFTPEEDETLKKAYIDLNGDWEKISALLPYRGPRQCRDRWENYLNPKLNRGEWTEEEDMQILELVDEHGRKWSKINTFFEGRSATAVKNRFNILERQMNKEEIKKRFQGIEPLKLLMNRNRKPKNDKAKETQDITLKKDDPKDTTPFDNVDIEEFVDLFENFSSKFIFETNIW